MPDWQTPFAALSAAIVPSSTIDSIKRTVATTPIFCDYTGGDFDGSIGANPFPEALSVTVTTSVSRTSTYKTGPGVFFVQGFDAGGNACRDALILTSARGGETVSTQALFASVSAILIFGQVDTNGSFQFGTANAPTASEIAGAQAVLSTLAAAGAAYAARVENVGAVQNIVTPPQSVQAGAGPQIFRGFALDGTVVNAYAPVPVAPLTGPVSANDLYRALRFLALLPSVSSPTWAAFTAAPAQPNPFIIDAPSDPSIASQLNATWPIVQGFIAAQTSPLPSDATEFLNSTLLPLIASAKAWAQYLRDMPAVTWSGAPPVPTGLQAAEPLASTDPALVAVRAAIASASAYLQFVATP
jgi:hypothetical protein